MKFARNFLIFTYGLFTIAAQALLFRQFLTSLEGNDISVGIFFASFFFWIAVGSLLLYRLIPSDEKLQTRIELLFLAYLPALLLQIFLTVEARSIFGIPSFSLLPLRTILLLSLIVNAPVSMITGLLFPLICRWVRQDAAAAISKVYIIESAGSFTGGLAVTVMLSFGANPIIISLVPAFLVSISILFLHIGRQNKQTKFVRFILRPAAFILPLCIIICIFTGIDKKISDRLQSIKWSRILPAETFAGSFQTSQAEYLYGSYRGQFLTVSQAAVIDALPDDETSGKIAAIALCQKSDAKNFLVIGSSLDLCRQFLKLKQANSVCWAFGDAEYIQKLNSSLPEQLKITDSRFSTVTGEIRSFLATKNQTFDIVIINLPDAASSVLNRYYTIEFYQQIKNALRTGGIVAVRVSGGENIMGSEITNLGASTKLSLGQVFSNLVLTAGSQTFFIASDSQSITDKAGILRERLQSIDGSNAILPADALFSIYLPDRAQKALDAYNNPDIPPKYLFNSDEKPLAHLFSLLLTVKQSDAPLTKFARLLLVCGILIFLIPIVVYAAVRLIYIIKEYPPVKNDSIELQKTFQISNFDSTFLVFSAGLLGIGTVIILMYLYQTQFGSLYLHIGIISSLFMLGLSLGAAIIKYLHEKVKSINNQEILAAVVCGHAALLACVAYWPIKQWGSIAADNNVFFDPGHLIFAAAFLLSGLCAGTYFPIAARQFSDSSISISRSASLLETADHVGACSGSLLTGLLLVPLLGTKQSLLLFIILILVNLAPLFLKNFRRQQLIFSPKKISRLTSFGYALFAIALIVILSSNILLRVKSSLTLSSFEQIARSLAPTMEMQGQSAQLTNNTFNYYRVHDANNTSKGFIFSSEKLAPDVRGFAGKINLAVFIDPNGRLIDYQIISSNETPEYLKLVTDKKGVFIGRPLFSEKPFYQIDAVTGATISYNAIIDALQTSAQNFARGALGETIIAAEKTVSKKSFDYAALFLTASIIASIFVIFFGGFKTRLVILFVNFLIAGLLFNAQYSIVQITNILSLNTPAAAFSIAFLVAAIVPVLVLLLGNIYCGYLCPFGALQELLGLIIPRNLKVKLTINSVHRLSFVKYVILFIFIIAFFVSANQATLSADPLVSIFSRRLVYFIILLAAASLIGSIFYTRFWCRFLCPTGAFLSLLNRFSILKKLLPAKRFAHCEFGVTRKTQADCLYCERCRLLPHIITPAPKLTGINRMPAFILFVFAAVIAVTISAATINKLQQSVFPEISQSQSIGSGRLSENVDLQKIRTMIERNTLSDKEALFYEKIEE